MIMVMFSGGCCQLVLVVTKVIVGEDDGMHVMVLCSGGTGQHVGDQGDCGEDDGTLVMVLCCVQVGLASM